MRGDLPLAEAAAWVAEQPYSRYPVIGDDFDDVIGFVHVRDLLVPGATDRTVADVRREVPHLPGTNHLLPTIVRMREEGVHRPWSSTSSAARTAS
ncbi:CBS domain-containing protein [Nocardioides convexus]|uniref:CBS domain-containing protein n=1 Tax=Nocardioides convexus TaxID=2712224 RepID=UPI0024181EB1|nr:CBS domain-containing protein [Nocardioides convexus]